MTSIVIAPDSFKGSLSASEVALAIESGIRRVLPNAEIRRFPMADGGEGTLDAMLAATDGQLQTASMVGDTLVKKSVRFAVLDKTAVIEVAEIIGLPNAQGHVAQRSSYGVGALLRHCMDLGIRKFMVGLGGSSTNDGGAGVLAALGVGLIDADGSPLPPTLGSLERLSSLDFSQLDPRIATCEIMLLADVNNPLCGEKGATAVFGPQKGIEPELVQMYDDWIANFARSADQWAGRPVSLAAGAGAAGGIGYALQLLGATPHRGAEMICRLLQIDAAIKQADWILTGEGRTDTQTLMGKVPFEIAGRAKGFRKPVSLLSGSIPTAEMALVAPHFSGCFSIISEPMPIQTAIAGARTMLANAAEQMARIRFVTVG
ncbi:glycerate kinase [Glaciimonas sp. PCH181]|uniref:glycerate kinase n=1 Tax=Glaciimonas sp. PCH181 TaxID=2133943 RepID=UPI000D3B6572|nr:glycerate kinase [Glaciimonas sp. PCH181]PUA17655.1 glycerate kinase [Glaciimonas sp. PCH181]